MQIGKLKQMITNGTVIWTNHGRKRMEQRRISKEDVVNSILQGEIIEDYPNSYPYPSCLVLGKISKTKIIHAVIGYDGDKLYLITVYEQNETKFETNFRNRRER